MRNSKEADIAIIATKTKQNKDDLIAAAEGIDEFCISKIVDSDLICYAISNFGAQALNWAKENDLSYTLMLLEPHVDRPYYLTEFCKKNKIAFEDLMKLSLSDKQRLSEVSSLSQFILNGNVSVDEVLGMHEIQLDYLNNLPQQSVKLILGYKPKITLNELLNIPPLAIELLALPDMAYITEEIFNNVISLSPKINSSIIEILKTGPLGKLIKDKIIPDDAAQKIRPEVYQQLTLTWSPIRKLVEANKISYQELNKLSLVDLKNIAHSKNEILANEVDIATVLKRGALAGSEAIGTIGKAVSGVIEHLKGKYPNYNNKNNGDNFLNEFIEQLKARAADLKLIKILFPNIDEEQQLKLQGSLILYVDNIKNIPEHYKVNIFGLSGAEFYTLLAYLSNDTEAFKSGTSKDDVLDAILTAINENMINGYIKQDGSLIVTDRSATACNTGLGEKIIMALWPVHNEVELNVTGSMALLEARGPKVMEEQIVAYISSLQEDKRNNLIESFKTQDPSKASICDCEDEKIKAEMLGSIRDKVLKILSTEFSGIEPKNLTGYVYGGLEYATFSLQKPVSAANIAQNQADTLSATHETLVGDFKSRFDKATIEFAKAGLEGIYVSYAVQYLLNARNENRIKDMSIANIVKGMQYARMAEPPIDISSHGDIKQCCEYAMNYPMFNDELPPRTINHSNSTRIVTPSLNLHSKKLKQWLVEPAIEDLEIKCATLSIASASLIEILQKTKVDDEQLKQAYNEVKLGKEAVSNIISDIDLDTLRNLLGGDNANNFALAVDLANNLLEGKRDTLDFYFSEKASREAQTAQLTTDQRESAAQAWLESEEGKYYKDQYDRFGGSEYRNLGNEYSSKIPDGKNINDSGMELYETMRALAANTLQGDIKDQNMIDYKLKEMLKQPISEEAISNIQTRLSSLHENTRQIKH